MQVAHRRLDVRVAHVALHLANVPHADGERAVRVAQVVEDVGRVLLTLVAELGTDRRGVEGLADLAVVERPAVVVREDEVPRPV